MLNLDKEEKSWGIRGLRWGVCLWVCLWSVFWYSVVFAQQGKPAASGENSKAQKTPEPSASSSKSEDSAEKKAEKPEAPTSRPVSSEPKKDGKDKGSTPAKNYVPGVKTDLTILFTNDLYGQLRDFRCDRPGVKGFKYKPAKQDFANLLYQVNHERKEALKRGEPEPLLFNTGDNLATSISSRFLLGNRKKGVPFFVDVFRRFRYDGIGIGNHEFSVSEYLLKPFLQGVERWKLPLTVANLVVKKGSKHALAKYMTPGGKPRTPYLVLERAGFKIGVFHVVPNELEKKIAQHRVKGIAFGDPKEAANAIVKELRETHKVDMVIALSHLEWRDTQGKEVRAFIKEVEGIDLVITNEMRVDGTPMSITIASSESGNVHAAGGYRYGTQLGRIRLRITKKPEEKAIKSRFVVNWVPFEDDDFDAGLRKDLLGWEKRYCKLWGSPLGQGRIASEKGVAHKDFLQYLLNLIRWHTKTEVAFINLKAVKNKNFPLKGYVTRDDIFRAFPFNEPIVVMHLTGEQIKALAEKYSDTEDETKKLLFAGVDSSGDVNGRTNSPKNTYRVATIRFIAGGAEGWLSPPPTKKIPGKSRKGKPLRLRSMTTEHFKRNEFFALFPTLSKQAAGKSIGIPFEKLFLQLEDIVAWTFKSDINLNFASIFITPGDISKIYNQKDTFNSNFFQKFQISGALNFAAQLDTRMHLWKTRLSLEYEADVSSPISGGQTAPPAIYQENTDRILFRTEYHFRYFKARYPGKNRWYFTSPFVEGAIETEFSRGNRPDQTVEQYFENNKEIFRHFETRGKLGLSFQFFDPLTFKIGFAWRKEWALELQVKPGNVVSVNLEHNIGLSVDYELSSTVLFKIRGIPFSWESSGSYLLTFLISPRVNQPALDIHDISWDNKFSFPIVGSLELVLGFKLIAFRGAYRQDNTNENSPLVSGPWALRLEPRISLRFAWDTRGQTF